MPTKQEIEARDAHRSFLQRQVPGLTCWIVYEPEHPDTDLWLNCLVAAYNANPTELVEAAQGGRHRIVAERMYDRIKAEEEGKAAAGRKLDGQEWSQFPEQGVRP